MRESLQTVSYWLLCGGKISAETGQAMSVITATKDMHTCPTYLILKDDRIPTLKYHCCNVDGL